VVELVPRDDGLFEERPPPPTLTSGHVTILDVYGSLMYAGSRTLQAHLPDPGDARSPVVVLRLRRRTSLGATFVKVVADYADRLEQAEGRLYLSGLDPALTEQLRRTGHIDGPVRAFEASPVVGESTRAAYLAAEAWLPRPGSSKGTASGESCGLPSSKGRRPVIPPGWWPSGRAGSWPGRTGGVTASRPRGKECW